MSNSQYETYAVPAYQAHGYDTFAHGADPLGHEAYGTYVAYEPSLTYEPTTAHGV